MSAPDEFYIGYLVKAPPRLSGFTRRIVVATAIMALALGLGLAITLPYYGAGEFEFGRAREFAGTLRCESAPRLIATEANYVLVGAGKHGVPSEICGANGSEVILRGTLIRREGRQAIEVESVSAPGAVPRPVPAAPSLGRFMLTGEIVDSKCYFGVMNPGEGRLHRACAEQCLRGGVPAVFVARDRTGAIAHLLLAGPAGEPINQALLRWAGESVEAIGEVRRAGSWLVWQIEPATIRRAD